MRTTRDRELIRVGWRPRRAHVAATTRNLAISAPLATSTGQPEILHAYRRHRWLIAATGHDDLLLEWRLHTRRLKFEPLPPGHAWNLAAAGTAGHLGRDELRWLKWLDRLLCPRAVEVSMEARLPQGHY